MEDDEIPYYQETKVEGDSLINKLKRIVTSSLLFILSFIISNMLLQIFIAWIATGLKYKTTFAYNHVKLFPLDYHYWNRGRVVVVFLFSPLICLVLGLLAFNLLRVFTNWSNISRIFFFWLAVNLVNLVLTHALLCPLGSPLNHDNGLYQTFSIVGAWISPGLMGMVAIGALISTMLLGVGIRKEVMRYSFSKKLIDSKRGMDLVVIQVFVLPVLAGSLPLIMLCTPIGFFTTVMQIANLGIISIGIFMMNSIGTANVRCIKSDVLNHFPIIELAICGLVWFGVFVFLK